MNGAESLVQTAVDSGVEVCFTNPGTTEIPLVVALDRVRGMRGVLGLFEGVCTGAADGYGRVLGKPAMTLLHLGPGFANGIANLHNARRAHAPIVNLIGDHASWHVAADPPLASDIESLARPVSGWVHANRSAARLAADVRAAIEASLQPPGQVATLIVPHDYQADEGGSPTRAVAPQPRVPKADAVRAAAAALRSGKQGALYLGGAALRTAGLRAAARIAAASGCRVFHETFAACMDRGAGIPTFERLPYFPEQIVDVLTGTEILLLAGAEAPVAFFGYPGGPRHVVPAGCAVQCLAAVHEDVTVALETLADELGCDLAPPLPSIQRAEPPTGELTPYSLSQAIAALQPEGAIVIEEAATSGVAYFGHAQGSPPHLLLNLTGGAIGQGLPNAVGAAIACPDRRVIAFQADGSGMYTLQALWTMAREGLDVTVVLCANRSYRILQFELVRAGVAEAGPNAMRLTELTQPELCWVDLSRGMGVPAVRVETADALVTELRRSFATAGPSLIEALL